MPLLNYSDPKLRTYYDVLDAVRRWPAMLLGGIDERWVEGTRMPRLQAFLSGLHFANLDDGDPPFSTFGAWLAVRVDGIPDSHNLPFHWLEERERGADSAFDAFFALLDEYRTCKVTIVKSCHGPFKPNFTVGVENPRAPEHPTAIVLGRFAPSKVFFWSEVGSAETRRHFPFFRSLRSARSDAEAQWGVARETWSAL